MRNAYLMRFLLNRAIAINESTPIPVIVISPFKLNHLLKYILPSRITNKIVKSFINQAN